MRHFRECDEAISDTLVCGGANFFSCRARRTQSGQRLGRCGLLPLYDTRRCVKSHGHAFAGRRDPQARGFSKVNEGEAAEPVVRCGGQRA